MNDLTHLQKRILLAALANQGHIILWVLKNGRWNLPGFSEDVGNATRTLESAGLLLSHDPVRRGAALPQPRQPGSYVFDLTANGQRAATEATGKAPAPASPK